MSLIQYCIAHLLLLKIHYDSPRSRSRPGESTIKPHTDCKYKQTLSKEAIEAAWKEPEKTLTAYNSKTLQSIDYLGLED